MTVIFISVLFTWIVTLIIKRAVLVLVAKLIVHRVRIIANSASLTLWGKPVVILYTNWQGETRLRKIIPTRLYRGSNEWHKKEQWLLDALDVEKNKMRCFAVNGIEVWGGKDDSEVGSSREPSTDGQGHSS